MMNQQQKQEIRTWIDEHYEKIISIRIRIGQSHKAETVAILTTKDFYETNKNSELAAQPIEKENLLDEINQVIDQNGYGDSEPYCRLYALNDQNKQFATIQKTTKLHLNEEKNNHDSSIVESISRVVQPLAQALLKSNQQLINAHEILTHANGHYQDTTLRMLEALYETKEEGIDYQNLALQMKVLLDNQQAPTEDYNSDLGDKVLSTLNGLMGMGIAQEAPAAAQKKSSPGQEQTTEPKAPRPPPDKEEMKAWVNGDPGFVMSVAEVFDELQQQPKEEEETHE